MKIDIRRSLPCSPQRFWQMYWSDSFDAMLMNGAAFDATLLAEHADGPIRRRTMRFEPHRELPRPVAAIVGAPKLSYEQENLYDADAETIVFTLIPSFLPDKLSARGVLAITSSADGCVLSVTGEVHVRVSFIGGRVESAVVQEVTESYDRMVATAHQWLAEHGCKVS